jgi:methyltransferase (TIGR00027 family)
MKNNSPINIRPALTLAYLRAVESYRPTPDRLFDDYFSRDLIPASWKISLLPGIRQAIVSFMEAFVPGLIGDLYCRTRYIDETLNKALRGGIKQVVILGAGFDARPYRIHGIEQAQVFELDLPAPQRLKQSLVEKRVGKLPAHVTFVPIDFDKQDPEAVLAAAGFRRDLKTFFIWEGTTQYLTEAAVDRIFRYMGRAAAGGSLVVFTYVHQNIIDGTARSPADLGLISTASEARTPWIFGFMPSHLPAYLRERGLERVEELGAEDFQVRYLKPRGREMNIFKGERVVLATFVINHETNVTDL